MGPTTTSTLGLRRHDLDNLRTSLTSLVIAHHAALPYGGSGSWSYKSPLFKDMSPALLTFNAVNQSFFMGLFFYISGRMSAQALSRSSPGQFIRSKVLRLGLPAIVYTLAIHPTVIVLALQSWDRESLRSCLGHYWRGLRGIIGPVWYTATLLTMDFVAAVVVSWWRTKPAQQAARVEQKDKEVGKVSWLNYRTLCKYGWLAVAATSFLVRMRYPVGKAVGVLNVQPAYLTQYIYAYTLGHLAIEEQESRLISPFESTSPTSSVKIDPKPSDNASRPARHSPYSGSPTPSLPLALTITLVTFPLAFLPSLLTGSDHWLPEAVTQLLGGCNLLALIYAVWNELGFVLIGPALMANYQKWQDRPATSKIWKARYSYAAFLVHAPVSVAIERVVDWVLSGVVGARSGIRGDVGSWAGVLWTSLGPVILTAAVGAVSCAASFVVGAWLVEHVPGLRKII